VRTVGKLASRSAGESAAEKAAQTVEKKDYWLVGRSVGGMDG
jgi:hypothetical protein